MQVFLWFAVEVASSLDLMPKPVELLISVPARSVHLSHNNVELVVVLCAAGKAMESLGKQFVFKLVIGKVT
jgi:hypothetical protein